MFRLSVHPKSVNVRMRNSPTHYSVVISEKLPLERDSQEHDLPVGSGRSVRNGTRYEVNGPFSSDCN
jgi:hypothetical protein